jgi:hypothetical protein
MLNQITKMRLPDGSEAAFVDWSDKPLYSTAELLHGFTDQEIPFFNYVVGDDVSRTANALAGRTASERDTNIATSNAMASTEEMLVYSIKPEFYELLTDTGGANPTDLNTAAVRLAGQPVPRAPTLAFLFMSLILRLVISQKHFPEAGLGYFPTGFGVYGAGGTVTLGAASRTYAGSGFPSHDASRAFAMPHHIGGQEKWGLVLANPAGNTLNFGFSNETTDPPGTNTRTVMRIIVNLDGLYKRPTA